MMGRGAWRGKFLFSCFRVPSRIQPDELERLYHTYKRKQCKLGIDRRLRQCYPNNLQEIALDKVELGTGCSDASLNLALTVYGFFYHGRGRAWQMVQNFPH